MYKCIDRQTDRQTDKMNKQTDRQDEQTDRQIVMMLSLTAQADLIKNAMAGFSLPSSVTPDWAKLMPEEVWKKQLQTGLTIRQIPPIKNCEAKKKDKS